VKLESNGVGIVKRSIVIGSVECSRICRGGFMLAIFAVTIPVMRTHPYPLSTFKPFIHFDHCCDLRVAGGVRQVCMKVIRMLQEFLA
jgi:hypothetical protein